MKKGPDLPCSLYDSRFLETGPDRARPSPQTHVRDHGKERLQCLTRSLWHPRPTHNAMASPANRPAFAPSLNGDES